jgi:outer membrane protein OmpA-like peptidoglycan-associated protein
MDKKILLASAVCLTAFLGSNSAKAQETATVVEEQVVVTENVECKDQYYSSARDNWFIQVGAGIDVPFVERIKPRGGNAEQITATYNVGFGKWFSPYMGWRLSFQGGAIHWCNNGFSKAKMVNGNLDFMWDMFNSIGGVNSKRVFSIVPFVGLGGTFVWDYNAPASNDVYKNGQIKRNQWLLPVSAGLQFRFRLCKYADFFLEARAGFYGDNFNNCVMGRPIDINVSGLGGFSFNIGGAGFKSYNPCQYIDYINNLNGQVNDLRGALAATTAALAACEAQLPCPEVQAPAPQVVNAAPLMATVRFRIGSATITPEEKVNVYNIAQWMKANPDQNVVITGYADKDTGTSSFNMALSKRRAQAVNDMLVKEYGIDASHLATDAQGSNVQPYKTNNWNRIVIFNVAE